MLNCFNFFQIFGDDLSYKLCREATRSEALFRKKGDKYQMGGVWDGYIFQFSPPPTHQARGWRRETLPHQMGTYKFLFIFQVKIERIHIDGLGRTKDEIAIEQVKDVFQASTFKELIERSGEAKLKLERLGIFTGVGVLIDTSKGMGSAGVVHVWLCTI